jgi:hypothetical protein
MHQYLNQIPYDLFGGIPHIYVVKHHIKGWRYFATYDIGGASKQLIFQKLKDAGQPENKSEWDLHHVVERIHLEPLFSPPRLDLYYNSHWPTVLLHAREEHHMLNSLFRSKGTLEGLEKAGPTPLAGAKRTAYLNTLYNRYQDIYTGDWVLQKVAHNVIRGLPLLAI